MWEIKRTPQIFTQNSIIDDYKMLYNAFHKSPHFIMDGYITKKKYICV